MKETFGQRFSRLRKSRGLTQGEVAEKLNISGQAVSKWENDLSAPDISILSDIADIFNVSIDTLLGREKEDVVKMDEQRTTALPNAVVPIEKEVTSFETSKLVFKIKVISNDGDVVKINLPLDLVKAMAVHEADGTLKIHGMGALDKIDLKQVLDLAEHGVLGNLLNISSADGDVVKIYVGKSDDPEEDDNKFRSGKRNEPSIVVVDNNEKEEENKEESNINTPEIDDVRSQIKQVEKEIEKLKGVIKSGSIKDVIQASAEIGGKSALLASLSLRLDELEKDEENKKSAKEEIEDRIDELKDTIEETSDLIAEGEIPAEEGSRRIKDFSEEIKELTDQLNSLQKQ